MTDWSNKSDRAFTPGALSEAARAIGARAGTPIQFNDEPALVSPGHFLGTVVTFASEALSESCWPEWEMTIGHKRGHVAVAVVKRVLVVGAKAAKVATVRSGNPASVLSAVPLAHGVELSASFGWALGDMVSYRDLRDAIRADVATMHERIRAAVESIEAGGL